MKLCDGILDKSAEFHGTDVYYTLTRQFPSKYLKLNLLSRLGH